MHRDDGWEPPPGFDEWLAEWHSKDTGGDKSKPPLASSLKRKCAELWPPSRRRRVSDEHDQSKWVWRPCNALSEPALAQFLAEVNATEDVALRALFEANYDVDQARQALGAAPCASTIETSSHSEESDAMASYAAACSLIAGIKEPLPKLRVEQSRRMRRRQWTDDDVHRFGEAMLECDRDCRAALKKLRRRDSFSNAHLADVLDLYYGVFKSRGQHYSEWKARLISRRGPRDAHANGRPRLNVVVKKSTPPPPPPLLPLLPQEDDKEEAGLVFTCPCGCGSLVDNRGRPASHRRKWATRSCRDRAARKGVDDPCDSPPDEDVVMCMCGCGETVDNRGRPSSHRKKWASAACRQRAHSERAKELRRAAAESHATPAVPKPTFVHAGVIVAIGRECAVVEQRATAGRWLIRFTGGPRDGERQEIPALDVAALLVRDVPCVADAMTFRGVTRKYSESPRYNAAFSLLGDRFSLGAFESATRAARAWDVIAWTSGRDDLNVSDFLPPKPNPTRAELHMLAKHMRDAMRLRTCPVADLSKCGVEVDAVPRGATSDAQVIHVCVETRVVAPRVLTPTASIAANSLSLPRLLFAACLERLADNKFAVGLGAAVASRGQVLVVTARLSRRWLVECFERSSSGDDNLLVEMSAEALEAVGTASFALLSRGQIDAADSPDTVAAVTRFMKAQFVDKRLSDGRIKILDIVPEASRLVVKATDLVDGSSLDLELHDCSREILANHRASCTRLLLTPPKDDSAKHAVANVLLPPLPVA